VDYASETALAEYLLLHYGSAMQAFPWSQGPVEAWDYPARCAALALEAAQDTPKQRALELGCSVGRATFELSAHFDHVTGIDYSRPFIETAQRLQSEKKFSCHSQDEGLLQMAWTARLPAAARPERIDFRQGDACHLPQDLGVFDLVLLANLLCRLPDPAACLKHLQQLTRPGSIVVITTPCTWSAEFTPPEKWLGGFISQGQPVRTLDGIKAVLNPDFEFVRSGDLPFLFREHARKYQWVLAQLSIWRRRA